MAKVHFVFADPSHISVQSGRVSRVVSEHRFSVAGRVDEFRDNWEGGLEVSHEPHISLRSAGSFVHFPRLLSDLAR